MVWVLSLICIVGLLIDILYIKSEYSENPDYKKSTFLKGSASLFFVILGIVCFMQGKPEGGMLIVIGLLLGMVGDVLLNMRYMYEGAKSNKIFAVGILAFLLGHFLYIAFLISNSDGGLIIGIVLTAVISVLAIPPLMKRITPPSKGLKIFGYVYLVVVIAMFSFATSMLISLSVNPLTIIFEIGAFLFLISDFIMIYYTFGKKIKPLRAINLLSYYIGQLLIAVSILFLI